MDIAIIEIVKQWFDKAENWQKDLFNNFWKGKSFDESVHRARKLINKEYDIEDSSLVANTHFPTDLDTEMQVNSQTLLKGIYDVSGVGALNPTKPLMFTTGLNVVYGENGCGKSSYVRILKKAENPKSKVNIYNNIFAENSVATKAILKFDIDGVENSFCWTPSNVNSCSIRIYDSQVAQQFVEYTNEIVYEPKLMHIFSNIAKSYDIIRKQIEDDIEDNRKSIIQTPVEIANSELLKKYELIRDIQQFDKFFDELAFDETQERQLELINNNFKDSDPKQRKRKLITQRDILDRNKSNIIEISKRIDDSRVESFLSDREILIASKKKLDEFIENQRSISKLVGFGSEEWKRMWQSSIEYKHSIENSCNTDNLCVLCQQEISNDAKTRFEKFNEVYRSTLQTEYLNYYKAFKSRTDELSQIKDQLNLNVIEDSLVTNSMENSIIKAIVGFYKKLLDRTVWMHEYGINKSTQNKPEIATVVEIVNYFTEVIDKINEEIQSVSDFIEDYDKQLRQKIELQSLQWLVKNREVLKPKKTILKLENIIPKLKTYSITKTKNALSDKMITEVYVKKFNEELNALNPTHSIKVELKSDGKKGKTSHRVSIYGTKTKENKKINEILSEGEYRVVSLAAFLADLNSWNKTQAFIFDDPITSLDHVYEDLVAERLVKLSLERQVIVFTHRIAFAETLNLNMEKVSIDSNKKFSYIELRKAPLGEPTSTSEYNKLNFKATLNSMLCNEIPKLKKIFADGEYDIYDSKLKSLCSNIRITVENGIEKELLYGLVTRYNRNISSQKVRYLRAIKEEDVSIFDEMMTKYSCYEHSQPSEKTVPLPKIEELENDINKLLAWQKKFSKERNKY